VARRTLQRDKRNGHYFVWIRRGGVKKYFRFGRNKRAAGEELDKLEADIVAGNVPFGEQETTAVKNQDGTRDVRVEELAVKHLEWVKANRSQGTFQNRRNAVLRLIEHIGGREPMVSAITRFMLEKFQASEKRKHGRGPNGGIETVANVKAMLRWGFEMGICDLPFRGFPKASRTPPDTKRIPEDDLTRLVEAADEDLRDVLLFGLFTGLRPGELIGLRRSHVVANGNGVLYVLIERHKTSRTARTPRPRTVPLCNEARAIFQRQTAKHPDSDFVFLNAAGTPYTRYAFKTRLARLCRRAKTSRVHTPYALRHTFASMESDSGIETTSLARLMGHTTTRTLERYVSNTFEHHLKAVEAMQNRVMGVLAGDRIDAKCATECATEKSETKRTRDVAVASPADPTS
jgi:integrase